MKLSRLAAALFMAGGAAALAPAPAQADRYLGYVTAESLYGNGSVTGPVRQGPYGLQVKIPGGPWLDCRRQGLIFGRNRPCAETLRVETVDFWESQQWNRGGNEN